MPTPRMQPSYLEAGESLAKIIRCPPRRSTVATAPLRAKEPFRCPNSSTRRVIKELKVGEALVSARAEERSVTQRTMIRPPYARIGPLMPVERKANIEASPLFDGYGNTNIAAQRMVGLVRCR